MSDEKKFVDGLFLEVKTTQYGEIIKAGIKVDKFVEFLTKNQNQKGYVNIDILTTREGKKYAKINDYQAQPKQQPNDNVEDESPLPF